MSNSFFLRCICLTVVTMTNLYAWGQDTPSRPNILFLLADDQRTDTIGAYGNEYIQTPNLDRLAEAGFNFRRNYCMGSMSGAVCVPSRAMMMSGLSLFRVPSNLAGVPTLPERLGEAGYATFVTGKWHNQPEAVLRSFQKGKAILMGGMANHERTPVSDITADGALTEKRIGKRSSSALFADAAIDFLESHDSAQPFFAYVSFTAPHDPRNAPESYREPYYHKRPPLPPNFKPQHEFNLGEMLIRDENLAAYPRTPEVIRDQLAEYYALITYMDEQIGRILESLKENNLDKNTLIVFASDHGLALGSHGILGKQNLYEHSMGALLLFAGPGIPQGESKALTYLLDIPATLYAHANVPPPAGVEGKDLAPIWRGQRDTVRDTVFTAYKQTMRSVQDGRWKIIRYPKLNHTQLFDLKNDPWELTSLAERPEHTARVSEMMDLLRESQANLGDRLPLSTDPPEPMHIDMTGKRNPPGGAQPDWIVRKYFK